MDKLVYSIIFPVIAVGMMWRLVALTADLSEPDGVQRVVAAAVEAFLFACRRSPPCNLPRS